MREERVGNITGNGGTHVAEVEKGLGFEMDQQTCHIRLGKRKAAVRDDSSRHRQRKLQLLQGTGIEETPSPR